MIALQVLLISQVIVILCSPSTYAVPVYGTKKYVRSSGMAQPGVTFWDRRVPQIVRTQRHALSYPYDTNPYAQSYFDNYYYHPRESYYPVYYPKTSKYEVYQAVVPYYFNNDHPASPNYMYDYYNTADPIMDIEEDLLREQEREERENSQSIGQEMYFENDDSPTVDDNLDAINTAFLQNLIMTQIYNDAIDQNNYYQKPYSKQDEIYGKWEEYPENREYYRDDEEERDLKMVANLNAKAKSVNDEERLNFFNKGSHPSMKNWDKRRSSDAGPPPASLKVNGRKSGSLVTTTTAKPTLKSKTTFARSEGQKEEVLHRPATPVTNRLSAQALRNTAQLGNKQNPSVYDIIKQMLNMEKELESHPEVKPQVRKRIISSEDSLTRQLSQLKKTM